MIDYIIQLLLPYSMEIVILGFILIVFLDFYAKYVKINRNIQITGDDLVHRWIYLETIRKKRNKTCEKH